MGTLYTPGVLRRVLTLGLLDIDQKNSTDSTKCKIIEGKQSVSLRYSVKCGVK